LRNRHADLLRSFKIDHQLELHGLLYRQVLWLGTVGTMSTEWQPVPVSRARTLYSCGSGGRAVAGGLSLSLEDRSCTVHRHR
jgi:hypothetical protein